MIQKANFLIFSMIFVVSCAFCQNLPQNKLTKTLSQQAPQAGNAKIFALATTVSPQKILPPITVNYYSAHLGFFCKQEIKMEKITKLPFKFRLGSVQQCDWMEGKTNSLYYKQ